MNGPPTRIIVTDLRIPFIRLMLFFIKVLLALTAASVVVSAILLVASAVVVGLLGGNVDWLLQRLRP